MNERVYVVGYFNDDGILDIATNGIGPGVSGYSGSWCGSATGMERFRHP